MCFDLTWFENLLIRLVIIFAIIAIFKLLLPLVFSRMGFAGEVILRIINICIGAAITIFIIIIAFDLLSCLSAGGFHFRLPSLGAK
jgi:hypothetical protein